MLRLAHWRAVTLDLHGEFDISRGEEIAASIKDAIGGGVGPLAVDLSDVTFLDCYTIGLLLHAQQKAAAHGTQMYIVNATNPLVRLMLDLTGAGAVLQRPAHSGRPVAATPDGERSAAA
jgi:anti-anti-sigma factor